MNDPNAIAFHDPDGELFGEDPYMKMWVDVLAGVQDLPKVLAATVEAGFTRQASVVTVVLHAMDLVIGEATVSARLSADTDNDVLVICTVFERLHALRVDRAVVIENALADRVESRLRGCLSPMVDVDDLGKMAIETSNLVYVAKDGRNIPAWALSKVL